MKVQWEIKSLAEVCQIKPPKAEARQRISGKQLVSFVPMEALDIDQKFMVPAQTKPLEDVVGSYTYFADGDVLLAKITPCFENGKLGIADKLINGIGFGSSEYIVFRPSPALDKEWLYYFLSRQSFREEGAAQMSGAVGHKRVSKEFIESYRIPVPSLPEQRRIVAILDEAFDGITTAKANAERNLQNARSLFESHLQSVFTDHAEGWIETTLGQAYDVRDGTHDSPKFYDEGFPLVTSKNLKRDGLNFDSIKFISEEDYRKINERSAVDVGDVLFAMIGTIGNPVVVRDGPNFAIKNMALFKVPKSQSSDFLRYFLSADVTLARMKREANGTTQKFVGLGYLRNFPIRLPTFKKQNELVHELDRLSAETALLETIYQRKLAAFDELKQSLLYQAFTGAL